MSNPPNFKCFTFRSSVCFRIFSLIQGILRKLCGFLFRRAPLIIFAAVLIMSQPLISICIPGYKKPQYVVRCLESIIKQDYPNKEVVISDDSPDEDIKLAIQQFTSQIDIRYYHNQAPLKTPRNWNAALDKGNGAYQILMHQDDWFHSNHALTIFHNEIVKTNADFVFCQNTAIDEHGRKIILQAIPRLLKEMSEKPNHLLLAQVIGPPSNTLLKRSVKTRYDERLIWLVDVDYYSRMLKEGFKYSYIPQHLVSIGLHEDQTTVFVRNNPGIIVKENILFAEKIGEPAFADILIYDYYWRLLRNYGMRSEEDIKKQVPGIPHVISHMLRAQKQIPLKVLQFGPASKSLMLVNFLSWKMKSRSHE
ncbi:MAG: glycosyltransferase family 2 protein [Flavisolibacter sp.]